ncbi:cation:proton antiporter [Streptomyces lavendofoliae]|uniref:Integral membrane ion exchanger n=1 Tax=Streptomyces lavendofoliae TaxID=67314 RepID=A0A918M6Y1_9ACTN|nr:cation:proton antiporter [Streptomyces lavendofoliae]GGU54204.1 integral membrane ion exchanger [Streptomyces lavendofoliae]
MTDGRFLLALACLLLLTRTAGRLARRAGQPPVIAELAAGLLLGPSLLGAVAPAAHRFLFGPDVLPALGALAELGLVLYAFGIGRHLAGPAAARAAAPAVTAVSAASVLLPMAAGAVLALALDGAHAGPRATPAASALFLGCALSVTALPVLARILDDEGLTATPAGRTSLAAAAVGDAVAWCVLTAALIASGSLGARHLALTATGLVAVAVLLRARPGPTRRGTDLALTVAGCALAAAASSATGLHQLLGALLFGFVYGRHRPAPAGEPALKALDTVAATILLPCFFLGFGQRLDLGAAPWDGPLTAVLLLVAVLTKTVGCAAAGALGGLPRREWLRVGALMNSRGLTEIVVISVGHEAGLIDRALLIALTVVALATTAMTAPALRLAERLAARPQSGTGTGSGTASTTGATPRR